MGVTSRTDARGKAVSAGELLSNISGLTDGTWVAVDFLKPLSFTFEYAEAGFAGTVRIHASNREDTPAPTDTGDILGDFDETTETTREWNQAFRWIKASVPVYTSGTLRCVGLCAGA